MFPPGFTSQVLPPGSLPSPTTCHGLVALALSSFRTSVKWALYTDDMILTLKICLYAKNLVVLTAPPTPGKMGSEDAENSGPGTTVRSFGVVQDLSQSSSLTYPKNVKEVQDCVGTLGYWEESCPSSTMPPIIIVSI